MENKTKEQKLASVNRFIAQKNKALEMLKSSNLEEYIKGLKYAYSLSSRYQSVDLKKLIDSVPNDYKTKCISSKILVYWKDTYWFDKEKAESLLNYISEHSN